MGASLLFLVTGLFKFGFPEILLHVYYAVYSDSGSRGRRLKDFINGLATKGSGEVSSDEESSVDDNFLTGCTVC